MPATVSVNFRTVVHAKSNGITMAFPDVCKTPAPPAGPIPIPYPNIAQSTDTASGTSQVKCDGNPVCIQGSNFSKSNGDEAGSVGGVVSSCIQGKAEFVNYSFDVQFEGKGACRLADLLVQNKGGGPNTPPFPLIQPPSPPGVIPDDPSEEENEIEEVDFDDSDTTEDEP